MKQAYIICIIILFFSSLTYGYEPPYDHPKDALGKCQIAFIGRITEIKEISHDDYVSEAIAVIKIERMLIGLDGYENHYPRNNSLGFRFRIAMARSLVRNPDLILLDESFNEMPSDIKDDMYNLVLNIKHEFSLSLLIGTSNISEAVLLSDVIYLMDKNPGKILERIDVDLHADRTTDIIEQESFDELRSVIEKKIANFSKHKFMDYSF